VRKRSLWESDFWPSSFSGLSFVRGMAESLWLGDRESGDFLPGYSQTGKTADLAVAGGPNTSAGGEERTDPDD